MRYWAQHFMQHSQQLNLYRHLSQQQHLSYSAEHIAWAAGIAAAVFVLIALAVSALNLHTDSRIKQADQRKQNIERQIAEYKQGSQASSAAEIERLRSMIRNKQSVLAQLKLDAGNDQILYSDRLVSLGRQNLRGIWLQTISLGSGGEQVTLKGETTKGELVPEYLQALSEEPVFSGLRFDLLEIARFDENEAKQGASIPLQFEVSALPDTHAGGNS